MPSMPHLDRRKLLLLIFLTITWGINWPIMKYGVQSMPPLEFRGLSIAGGILTMYIVLRLRGESLYVPAGQRLVIFKLALSNMVFWHLVSIFAIAMLSSGRSAILAYTMPVWAALWGLVLYRERLGLGLWGGLACALAGTLLLLSGEMSAITGKPLGLVLMLMSAATWGLGTQMLRRAKFDVSLTVFTFWMLVVTAGFIVLATPFTSAWRWPHGGEWAAIAYNGVIVFGFCHIAWFGLARSLPPVMSSLSIMMIPVIGVFSGMAFLGETPHWQDYAAIAMILLALASVLFAPRRTE
jgi:drug/metabolite transporter (DMT)-like permease